MAGRDLPNSATADTNYGLFFTPRDMSLFNDYSTELLEIIAKTKVKYWKVEKDLNGIDEKSKKFILIFLVLVDFFKIFLLFFKARNMLNIKNKNITGIKKSIFLVKL